MNSAARKSYLNKRTGRPCLTSPLQAYRAKTEKHDAMTRYTWQRAFNCSLYTLQQLRTITLYYNYAQLYTFNCS
eukprot:scaffold523986_cov15-Prasinocladus_malaysianus.AAC.1